MTKQTAPSRTNAELCDLPIAHLDTQDAEQSLPIRQYLEHNGCAVVVNRKPAMSEEYHIICGDVHFVQATIASTPKKATKLFVVLFLGNNKNIPPSLEGTQAKIAAIMGHTLSTRDTHQLFAYFFTRDEEIYYLEKKESLLPDADRVSRVIGDMFGERKDREGEMRRPGDGEKMVERREQSRRQKKRTVLKASLCAFCIIAAPVMWYLVSLAMIAAVQWYGVRAISRGDVSKTATVAGFTTYWVGQGKGALALIGLPARGVGAGSVIRSQERVLSVVGDVATAERIAADLIDESRSTAPALLVGGESTLADSGSLPVIMDRMRLKLDELGNALGLAGAQVGILAQDPRFPFSLGLIRRFLATGATVLRRHAEGVAVMRNLLGLYRAAGGFDQKKTYLILLQNSMELRPTGGFIGSIATVTVEDGAMETPVVQDVYALDGQLKGHVDPPIPIKEVLQQEHWYLRDSNWDPDFRASGQRAAWFYEKETGQTVDGVIAVSTPVLTDILGVTGPLDLVDYNDRITKENFFGKSLFYTKADFFPGSTQKKDFLGSLMVAILGRVSSAKSGDASGLMRVVGRALAAGDIQFWFPQGQVQAIAEQAGWVGEVTRSMPCQALSPPCAVERVALVEANLGVNKVNPFIKRSVKTRIDVGEDGTADGAVDVIYQNTSTDDAVITGGGTYLAYLRAFLPADALILSAALSGVEIPGKAEKFSELTMPYRDTDETIDGSMVAGVAFTVPPGRERRVTITYRRGIPLAFVDDTATLIFSVRKQPGMTDTTLDAAIGYPAGWKLETETTGLLATSREVRYNTLLDQTKTFIVRFRK